MNTSKLSILREESSPGAPVVIHLSGPLVMATIADFQRTLRGEAASAVVLDFTEVPYIDSSGLGSMIGIHLHYKQSGRKLAITNMNDKCTALLRMTSVENLFPTFVSVDAARAALA